MIRVTDDDEKQLRMLLHGGTIHGLQSLDPARAKEPLSYYTKAGPVGQVFNAFSGNATENQVAIVGLGAGTMACYLSPPQQLTYYEIDPLVERIAENPQYFTFLRDCYPRVRVVLGDARLSLQAAPDHRYGIIILDAFSGDSIPVHLLPGRHYSFTSGSSSQREFWSSISATTTLISSRCLGPLLEMPV